MRLRARLIAALAVTTCAGACTGTADAGAPPPPPPPPAKRPVAAAPAPLAPGKVTPVTTLFIASQPGPAGEVAPPWSLTASDGSGLRLTRVDAKAVVEGPLAFTELHLYFHNPEARTREGTFSITLPAGAAVSRFAMESNGQFMEAEVVEKQLARRAYEDFLHRRQDPALLEKAEGNQFSARVFPIPAGADKHLVISYSQEVSPGHYTLPLRGLARSERVDVRVQVRGRTGGVAEQTLSERNWTPDRDVVVDGASIGAPAAIAAGELAVARVRVELPDAAARPVAVTILVDTSASRGLGFAAEARAVHQLVDELARAYGGALPVQVVAFDQTTAPLYDGRADKISGLEAALAARGALGASDLGQALAWLAAHAPRSRIVVVTDGVITAGAKIDALGGLARQLASRGVDRIDVALTGGIRDEEAAAAIAHAGLAHTGAIVDLDQGAAEAARRIGLAVRTEIPVAVDGARWVFPRTIAAAQAGDEVTVFVRRRPAASFAVTLAGMRTEVSPVAATPALLGRAVAGAEITDLDHQLATATGPAADKLRAEIVRRSVAARVVSSQTSMLVLESDADYARYGIDRKALAEILAIGPSGVELVHRAAPPVQIAIPVPTPAGKRPATKEAEKAKKQGFDDGALARTAKLDRAPGNHARAVEDKDEDKRGTADEAPTEAPTETPAQARIEARSTAQEQSGPSVQGGTLGASLPAPVPPPPAGAPRPSAGSAAEERRAGIRISAADMAGATGGAAAPVSVSVAREDRPRAPLAEPPRPSRPALRRRVPDAQVARDSEVDGDGDADGLANNRRRPALHGPLAEIERALATGHADAALARATAWHKQEPGDVLALIGLGDALEARRDLDTAARVYGSIIDLFPARADFRRFAGERIERLGKAQRALIVDTYRRAVEERPDHLTGHRLLAYALVRDGQYAEAFAAILAGIDRQYPSNRFAGAERVLAEDVGMIAAAYLAHGGKRDEVLAQLARRRIALATQPSTRFLMYWETDANDVDFHIRDARGGHAWYSHKQLGSGGELYADITTGYGPECFAIPGTPTAGPYRLSINYFSQGPMGYGMGLLQIQKFDGQGNLSFEDRPYVIMTDQAFVDLGTYR
jgi:hypothetical protein